jgi:hypothetical protein
LVPGSLARLAVDAQGSPSTGGGDAVIVYVVHAVRPNVVGPTLRVSDDLPDAERWAAELSTDPDVLAVQVIRFGVGHPGSRKPISLFVVGSVKMSERRVMCRCQGSG